MHTPLLVDKGMIGEERGKSALLTLPYLSVSALNIVLLQRMNNSDLNVPVDLATWPLRRIIAKSEAWDQVKRK